MSTLIRRRWVSLVLLSIIVPMGLLAAFRLTGIIPEPPTPETITLETVNWNMSRPKILDDIVIDQWAENLYASDIASIGFSVHVAKYYAHDPDFPAWGNDLLKLYINATANMSEGFIHSLAVRFNRTDEYAYICIHRGGIEVYNVQATDVSDFGLSEDHVEACGLNSPKGSMLGMTVSWIFVDKNNIKDHWVTVTLECVYFDGTAYKGVVVPILLGVLVS